MFTLQSIKVSKDGQITLAQVAQSDKPKQAMFTLKSLESKGYGWLLYQDETLECYKLPKSKLFSTLQELEAIFAEQVDGI